MKIRLIRGEIFLLSLRILHKKSTDCKSALHVFFLKKNSQVKKIIRLLCKTNAKRRRYFLKGNNVCKLQKLFLLIIIQNQRHLPVADPL